VDAAAGITPPQLRPAGQTLQQLACNVYLIADHMSRTPLDPHHAAFAGRKDNLDLHTVMGGYQAAAYLIGTGGIRSGSGPAAAAFPLHMNITMSALTLQGILMPYLCRRENRTFPLTGIPPLKSHPGPEAEQSRLLCYPAEGCQTRPAVTVKRVDRCHAGYDRVAAVYQIQQFFQSRLTAV
jgi:hypothetical protein